MERRVGLSGHSFDLEDLSDTFGNGDPRVVQEEGDYFLPASEFASFGDDHVGLLARARAILTQMNGAVLLTSGRHGPVDIAGPVHDPDGRQHAVVFPDAIEARSRVSAVLTIGTGESPQPPKSQPQAAVDAAATYTSAASVLRPLGDRQLDWVNLSRILDYVAHECGSEKGIVRAGLATDDEMDRFGATASRVEVSGDDARHGPRKGPPPTRR
jgi:hypothetical protein